MAERKRLFVSPDGALWQVQWEGGKVESRGHVTQALAIAKARAIVRSLPAGACSQIIVQRPEGKIREEWTYGKDPFPPPG